MASRPRQGDSEIVVAARVDKSMGTTRNSKLGYECEIDTDKLPMCPSSITGITDGTPPTRNGSACHWYV